MYGQKNFNEIQGINGRYRINQIGCFLTAFCNLEQRLGRAVDPLSLNAIFRDRGIYVDVDDGVRDDLGWGSITAYDPHTIATQIGTGWPSSNNAIVKFHYRSVQSGQMIDHFCLVADHTQKKIIDSWDGLEKVSPYGEPVSFAVYGDNTPQPVPPPAPAPQPQDPNFLYIKALDGYGISHLAKAANYPNFGEPLVWDRIAQANGFVNASQFHVKINVVYKVPIYKAEDYAPAPTPPPIPPAAEQPKPTDGEQVPVTVIPDGFKQTFTEEESGKYRALRDAVIKDLNNEEDQRLPDAQLLEGKTYAIAGWFDKGGVHYGRTANSVSSGSWHGIHEDLLESEDDINALDLKLADETRIAIGNLTRVEKFKRLIRNVKDFLLRRIGRIEAKQNK
jgi:hypothetical protein